MGNVVIPAKGSAEHREHLLRLARHVVANLFSWTMPADGGVSYGFERSPGAWERTYLSREEILSIIDWKPVPDFDADGEWPEEASAYAWDLLVDLGRFMREECVLTDLASGTRTA